MWNNIQKSLPKENESVLLLIKISYTVDFVKYHTEYIIQGYYSRDYDTGEYFWYNWVGDSFDHEEEVIGWMKKPKSSEFAQ